MGCWPCRLPVDLTGWWSWGAGGSPEHGEGLAGPWAGGERWGAGEGLRPAG